MGKRAGPMLRFDEVEVWSVGQVVNKRISYFIVIEQCGQYDHQIVQREYSERSPDPEAFCSLPKTSVFLSNAIVELK